MQQVPKQSYLHDKAASMIKRFYGGLIASQDDHKCAWDTQNTPEPRGHLVKCSGIEVAIPLSCRGLADTTSRSGAPHLVDAVLNDRKYTKTGGVGSGERREGQAIEYVSRWNPGVRKGSRLAGHEESSSSRGKERRVG